MNRAPAFKREMINDGAIGLWATPAGTALAQPDHAGAIRKRHSVAQSFRFAMDGFTYVVMTQRNFRIQLTIGAAAMALGAYCHLRPWEWVALVTCGTVVLVLEMLNTALEAAIDLITADYHPLAKICKDVAAGAVLLASAGAVVIGLMVFGPHLSALWAGRL